MQAVPEQTDEHVVSSPQSRPLRLARPTSVIGMHTILAVLSSVQMPWHSVSGPASSGSHGSWNVCVWHLPVRYCDVERTGSGPGSEFRP
jgi:hypothetical protein